MTLAELRAEYKAAGKRLSDFLDEQYPKGCLIRCPLANREPFLSYGADRSCPGWLRILTTVDETSCFAGVHACCADSVEHCPDGTAEPEWITIARRDGQLP